MVGSDRKFRIKGLNHYVYEANFSAWLAAFEATKLSKKSDKQPVDRRFFSA